MRFLYASSQTASSLPLANISKFHDQATNVILASIAREDLIVPDASETISQKSFIGNSLLSVIDATERQIPDDALSSILTKLKDKLSSLQLEITSSSQPTYDNNKQSSASGTELQMDGIWSR